MVIVCQATIGENELDLIRERVEAHGGRTYLSRGAEKVIIGCIGDLHEGLEAEINSLPGVESVTKVQRPYKLVASQFRAERTIVRAGGREGTSIGGDEIALIAGPCSVEGLEMLRETATAVQAVGAGILRGGAFKPRTSPYSFQGLGERGLEYLAEVRRETGMPVVTEVMDARQIDLVAEYADMLQVGARNMQNFTLLAELGRIRRPVLLKRGASATIEELLMAAEYLMAQGARDIILCERGIRTFERATRNTLDLSAIPVLKEETHLPVIADPSHAGGRADLVAPLAYGAVAAGADGLMIEVHPEPEQALSDGDQSLRPAEFELLVEGLRPIAEAAGRRMPFTKATERDAA